MITRTQFAAVEPQLQALRRTTRPRSHDLYDVFSAVLYLLEHDTPWRLLPKEVFPPWRTVHEYFTMWTTESTLYDALISIGQHDAAHKLAARLAYNTRYIPAWRKAA